MSYFGNFRSAVEYTYSEEGMYWVYKKAKAMIKNRIISIKSKFFCKNNGETSKNMFFDVMFINGCDYSLPHPIRYRIDHQMEQLEAAGFSCMKVDISNLEMDHIRQARLFVVYRLPYTPFVEKFIRKAQSLNKFVLYDIDDLVIDTKYTDSIPFIKSMNQKDRELYDNGVLLMGKTLQLCDGAITTTEALANELKKYTPKVFINRNAASDRMLKISQEAVYRRDILPYLDTESLPRHSKKKRKVWADRSLRSETIIGYFSGSITHNSDFEIVIPAIRKLMIQNSGVKLMIMGELDLPEQLKRFEERVISVPFTSWTRLPFYIAQCDINIAPLEDTLFNQAKSENKWIEASLVKVPTIASKVGAFSRMIENDATGLLCDNDADEWFDALSMLTSSEQLRKRIGEAAYEYCFRHCTTLYSCSNLKRIVNECITTNIAFILPSLQISGGILVAIKHGCYLQDAGFDVSYIGTREDDSWIKFEEHEFPVLDRYVQNSQLDDCLFLGWFDKLVATFWDTLDFALRYPKTKEVIYLVQGFEVDFYEPDSFLRKKASATYQDIHNVRYITVSKWCQDWLSSIYGVEAEFIPNGLDVDRFYSIKRDWCSKKIKILIEGDCQLGLKNIDEAFEIANQLDPEKFEIWYMSYSGKTKPQYRIDKNLGCVPQEKVGDIYRQCHILLKTSTHESFSFPPLEMLSTGGLVVVRPNEGNVEFLQDGENCIFYNPKNLDSAREAIRLLIEDEHLRDKLINNGRKTAEERSWKSIRSQIVSVYDDESESTLYSGEAKKDYKELAQ